MILTSKLLLRLIPCAVQAVTHITTFPCPGPQDGRIRSLVSSASGWIPSSLNSFLLRQEDQKIAPRPLLQ
jgi:hypothetical protein